MCYKSTINFVLLLFLYSQLVTSWKPKDFNLVSATKACNVHKNRNMDIIPIENSRVHLTPKPGVDGSDYINATWVSGKHNVIICVIANSAFLRYDLIFLLTNALFLGFQRNREFIITQHPMENTIMEFWQMMWDHNAQTIVMLTQCDEVRASNEIIVQEAGTIWRFVLICDRYLTGISRVLAHRGKGSGVRNVPRTTLRNEGDCKRDYSTRSCSPVVTG